MDAGAIAVIGTLAGATIGAVLTHLFQRAAAREQRRWAIEDEQRRRRRDLVSARLDVIKEAVELMSDAVHVAKRKQLGMPVLADETVSRLKEQRLQDVLSNAWSAVVVTGSSELRSNWSALVKTYWDLKESGIITGNALAKTEEIEVAIFKLLEEMRIQV